MIVLDTNIVLDAFLFNDPSTDDLKAALVTRQLRWMATPAMRDELARVLTYPKIMLLLARNERSAVQVLAQFDTHAYRVDVALTAPLRCADPDDQKFIDLAVQHKAQLLSKDRAVLCMAKRLQVLEVRAYASLNGNSRSV
jgi:putative PIN family toxin of toxin-antitoxin system